MSNVRTDADYEQVAKTDVDYEQIAKTDIIEKLKNTKRGLTGRRKGSEISFQYKDRMWYVKRLDNEIHISMSEICNALDVDYPKRTSMYIHKIE